MSRIALLCACATLALGVTACPPAERGEMEAESERPAETTGVDDGQAADRSEAEEGAPAGQAAGETSGAPGDPQAERRAVMDLDREWSARFGQGDVAWIANLHAQDARTLPPNAGPVVGREAIRGFFRDLTSTEGLSLSWQPEGARVSEAADMAYSWGSYDMRLPDGTEDRGKYLAVWIRQAGDWKVAADMFNSSLPVPTDEGAPDAQEEPESESSEAPEG